MEQTYVLGRSVVGVRTTSAEFGEWLGRVLANYRSDEKIGATYSIVVGEDAGRRPGKRYHLLYEQAFVVAKTFDFHELVRALIAELEAFLFEDWDQAVYARATIASSDGLSILLPNAAVDELNEITRKVERAGIALPMGGRLALDPGSGRSLPFPPRIRLSEEQLAEVSRLAGPNGGAPSTSGIAGQSGVDIVCLPMREADSPVLHRVSRASAVRLLAPSVVNLHAMGPEALKGLAQFIEGARCYEVGVVRDEDSDLPVQLLEGLEAAIASEPE